MKHSEMYCQDVVTRVLLLCHNSYLRVTKDAASSIGYKLDAP